CHLFVFSFTLTSTSHIYTLSLHDALPISPLEHGHDTLEAAIRIAVEDDVPHRFLQRLPGRVERELVPLGQDGQRLLEVRRLVARSEEHTSELQSPYDLVCRLLLEKKKKKK